MRRLIACLFLLLCALPSPTPAAERKRPKLLVAIVVDQFRYDYLLRFRSDYKAGLARLLDHGAVLTDAHLQHIPTVTAIGHSTFLSGATPSISGIVGNEWYDRDSKRYVTSVQDDSEQEVGGIPGKIASSPRRMLVSTIPDEIKMSGQHTKTIGISIKDRSAILPAGHMADAAYWFENDSNTWVTSSYYIKELPQWVKDVNATRPAFQILGQSWVPLEGGNPFCTMVGGAEIRFCGSLEATPWGNEMIETLAEHAIVNEQLGTHDGTDVLAVSFSSNDYVGHAMGPDSPEVRDISIRTDRLLGKFLDYVDQQVGLANTVVVLTADHGVAPIPEVNQGRKMPGGRISSRMSQTLVQALTDKYGADGWLDGNGGALYLNQELIRSKNLNPAEVEDFAAALLRKAPHIFRVYTRHQLMTGQVPNDAVSRAAVNGFYDQRSGDLTVIPEGFYLFGPAPGTSHGLPFNYDTHVPLIFFGAGIKPGIYRMPTAANDIAPTLAELLGVEQPSGSVGRVLGEIFE